MFCWSCGREIDERSKFCPACGAAQAAPKPGSAPPSTETAPPRSVQGEAAPAAPAKKAKRLSWKSLLLSAAVILLARAVGYGVGRLMAKDLSPSDSPDTGALIPQSTGLIGSLTQNEDGSYTWSPPEATYAWPTLDPVIQNGLNSNGVSPGWSAPDDSDERRFDVSTADDEEINASTGVYRDMGSGLRCYCTFYFGDSELLDRWTLEYVGRMADGFTAEKMKNVGIERSFPDFAEYEYGENSAYGFAYAIVRMSGLKSAERVQALMDHDLIRASSAGPVDIDWLVGSFLTSGWESTPWEDYQFLVLD